MNAEVDRVDGIEREVAAEVDLLVALLGVVPEALPGPSVEEAAPTSVDRGADAAADAAILASILATGRGERAMSTARYSGPAVGDRRHAPTPDAARALRPSRWWYGAAAAAAVAIGLAGALALNPSSPASADAPPMLRFSKGSAYDLLSADGASALPSARQALLDLGDAAEAAADPPSTGDVQYVRVSAWYASTTDENTVIEPVERQAWLAPDGSVRAEEARYGSFSPWGELVQSDVPAGVTATVDEIPAGSFDATLAATVSNDPTRVLDDLSIGFSGVTCDDLSCTTSVVEGLFTTFAVPAATRAAVWRSFAERSDLHLMGSATDRLGREGVGIGFHIDPGGGPVFGGVFIVDPANGALLGVERVVDMPDEEPRLNEVMAIARSTTVATVGDTP